MRDQKENKSYKNIFKTSKIFKKSYCLTNVYLFSNDMVGCFVFNGPLRQYFSLYRAVSQREGVREEIDRWLFGCFGFNGPLRQYFRIYRAVSQREGERGEKGKM